MPIDIRTCSILENKSGDGFTVSTTNSAKKVVHLLHFLMAELSTSSSVSSALVTQSARALGIEMAEMHVSKVTPLVSCTVCGVSFGSEEEQRSHYKSDEHVQRLRERYGHLWANPWPIKAGKSGKELLAPTPFTGYNVDDYGIYYGTGTYETAGTEMCIPLD